MPVHLARVSIDISIVMAMTPISRRVVAAFLLLGFWKAGTPFEIASTPVSAAQPDEKARSSRNIIAKLPSDSKPFSGASVNAALSAWGSVPGDLADQPDDAHADDARHEEVDRQREGLARLAHPAQVHRGEQRDQPDGDDHLVAADERQGGRGVLDTRGDRHRHGEDVVDEQRAQRR